MTMKEEVDKGPGSCCRTRRRIFIVGYYGFGLVSDDAVLQSLADDLHRTIEDLDIVATVLRAENLTVSGVGTVSISDFSAVLEELKSADLTIIGGGGVYNEDNKNNQYSFMTPRQQFNDLCIAVPILCACIGKPCAIIGVGVFSIKSDALQHRVLQAFMSASVASLRDCGSKSNLLKGTALEIAAKVTADPVFRLKASPSVGGLIDRSASGPIVGVSLRQWDPSGANAASQGGEWEHHVASALDAFVSVFDASCLFIPFQQQPQLGPYSDDLPVMKRILGLMAHKDRVIVLPVVSSPSDMAACIRAVSLMVSMRYHSLVMAVAQERPVVALGYSEKLKNSLEDIGLQDAVLDLELLGEGRLFARMRKAYLEADELSSKRAAVAQERARVAEENIMAVVELINAPRAGKLDPAFVGPLLFDAVSRASKLEAVVRECESVSCAGQLRVSEWLASREPLDGDAHYQLGRMLIERYAMGIGQPDDVSRAEHHLSMGLELGADEYWCLFFRACSLVHGQKYSEAIQDFDRASAIRPDRTDSVAAKRDVEEALSRQSRVK